MVSSMVVSGGAGLGGMDVVRFHGDAVVHVVHVVHGCWEEDTTIIIIT